MGWKTQYCYDIDSNKFIDRLNIILNKTLARLLEKSIVKFQIYFEKKKKTKIAETILENNKVGGLNYRRSRYSLKL